MNIQNNFPSLADKFKQIIADANLDLDQENNPLQQTHLDRTSSFDYDQFVQNVRANYVQQKSLNKYNNFIKIYFKGQSNEMIQNYIIQQFIECVNGSAISNSQNVNNNSNEIIIEKNKIIKNFLIDSQYSNTACQQACNLSINIYKYLTEQIKKLEQNRSVNKQDLQSTIEKIKNELLNVYNLGVNILKYMSNLENYYSESYYWNLEQDKERKKFEQILQNFQRTEKYFKQNISKFQNDLTNSNSQKNNHLQFQNFNQNKIDYNNQTIPFNFKQDLQKLLRNMDDKFQFNDKEKFQKKYQIDLECLNEIQQRYLAFQDHYDEQEKKTIQKTQELLYLYNYFQNLLNLYKAQNFQKMNFEDVYSQFINQNEKTFKNKINKLQQQIQQHKIKIKNTQKNFVLPHFTFNINQSFISNLQRRQTFGGELTARNGFQKSTQSKDLLQMLFIQAKLLEGN